MRDITQITKYMIDVLTDMYIPIKAFGNTYNIDLWRIIVALLVLGVLGSIIFRNFYKLMEG